MGHGQPGRQRGVTLVESMVVVAIAGIMLGSVAPSFGEARARRHLDGAAAQLETDMNLARSAAVARNESVRISFESGPGGSCYVAHTGPAHACGCGVTRPAACAGDADPVRLVRHDAGTPLTIVSNSASILFDAVKGTVTPTGSVALTNDRQQTVRLVVNIMGRVRACTPTAGLPGYPAC